MDCIKVSVIINSINFSYCTNNNTTILQTIIFQFQEEQKKKRVGVNVDSKLISAIRTANKMLRAFHKSFY